jgi:hypothetical protein
MNKKISIFFAAFFFLLSGMGEAFVPQAPHLLHLMIKKIKRPYGLAVHQTRNVMGAAGVETETVALDEKLLYVFPDKFRSEILSGGESRFYVLSDSQFVKVADGMVVALKKSPVDFYTDPLLYRNYESLVRHLGLAGVNTDRVTFQRFDNKICYFIGQPPLYQKESSGLWIEKTSLFPIRYVIKKNGWTVAFHYDNWQRVSKSWYPMQTMIYVDNQLFAKIDVGQIELVSQISQALFEVTGIRGRYPVRAGSSENEPASPEKMDELDQQIEIFKKLYE